MTYSYTEVRKHHSYQVTFVSLPESLCMFLVWVVSPEPQPGSSPPARTLCDYPAAQQTPVFKNQFFLNVFLGAALSNVCADWPFFLLLATLKQQCSVSLFSWLILNYQADISTQEVDALMEFETTVNCILACSEYKSVIGQKVSLLTNMNIHLWGQKLLCILLLCWYHINSSNTCVFSIAVYFYIFLC